MASSNASPPSSMANSLVFVVNPLPSTDDQLNERISDAAEKLRSTLSTNSSNQLSINAPNLSLVNFTSMPNSTIQNQKNSPQQQTQMSLLLPPPQSNPDSANIAPETSRVNVQQCVISRNYIAVLLEDCRICRFPYNILPERINQTGSQSDASSSSKKCLNSSTSSLATAGTSSSQRPIPSRRRLIRSSRPRSSASVIMGRSHMIPAHYVPEDLVNQAQVVLQGKSRNVIIRELQRTNLDVNLAVNNLLSRDDEDFEDAEEGSDQMIQSDDLMSLLDSGFHNDHSVIIDSDLADEVFTYPLRIRSSAIFNGTGSGGSSAVNSSSAGTGSGTSSSSRQRLREEAFSFLERDLQLSSTGSSGNKSRWYSLSTVNESKNDLNNSGSSISRQKKSDTVQLAPISLGDQQEFWPGPSDRKFVAIAATYSELIALTSTGQLCQWRWQDAEPFKAQHTDGTVYYHPKVPSLNLLFERVTLLSASCIRATVATEYGKVATFIDESIAPIASKLEHAATSSFFGDSISVSSSSTIKISALYVSSLMSCIQLSSGSLFWWGIPPFSHRKKMIEKVKNERSKSKSKSSSNSSSSTNNFNKDNEIVQGSFVCMRNSPIYQSGAIAFTTAGGVPKVGQLVNSAWKMTDSCSFRILSSSEIQARLLHHRSSSQTSSAKDSGNIVSEPGPSGKCEMSRTEMPPPPSPASSTGSDSGYTPTISKRLKTRNSGSQQNSTQEPRDLTTETWALKDVVFIEDVKNMPIGRVIKVDGSYVAVKFSHLTESNQQQQQSSSRSSTSNVIDPSFETYIQDCRLLRKDDLIAIRSSGVQSFSSSVSGNSSSLGNKDCFQKYPKRIHVPEHVQILTMTLSNLGLHAIAKIGGYKFSYILINIVTGRIEQDAKISIEYSTFFGSSNSKSSLIRLFSAGESESTTVVICRDGNGNLYPLAKDCTETVIREPISLNLGQVSTVALGVFALPNQIASSSSVNTGSNSATNGPKTHAAVIGLAFEPQLLMQAILKSDLDMLRERLSLLERYPHIYHSMIKELCDGNHNIIHIAVSVCFPTTNRPTTNDMNIPHIFDNDETMPVDRNSSVASESFNNSNDNSSESSQQPPPSYDSSQSSEPLLDPSEQKPIAHSILWTLLDSPVLSRHLFDLLSARDFQGLTPFMLAVAGRAYSAANQIFIIMQRVARVIAQSNGTCSSEPSAFQELYNRTFIQMLYPRGSLPDQSPLYMICSNDTCSFTWTGEEHINQDIFECRTCGLVGSLCCCTECARVCHRGHDCKLKRTSPTAYCDCWEKCKCKALIAGCQPARNLLLKRILSLTDLSQRVNSRGEHILLFLVQTVGRQIVEQKQYRPSRLRSSFNSTSSSSRNKTTESSEESSNVPEHDLEPPKFARRALEKLISDWPTVKSMILTGYRASENQTTKRRSYLGGFFNGTSNAYAYEEENAYLARQNGSALLDKFTHSLLRIGLNEIVERLITTIVLACKSPSTATEGRIVARRLIRSVARVSLVLCFELNPTNYAQLLSSQSMAFSSMIDRALGLNSTISSSSSSKKNAALTMLRKCRRLFVSFLPIAVEELCEIAESLIAPVKLGVARPSGPFVLSPTPNEVLASTDEIFAVDTQIYAHQQDFLDSTFGLDILGEPSAQENLTVNVSEFSYDAPMPPNDQAQRLDNDNAQDPSLPSISRNNTSDGSEDINNQSVSFIAGLILRDLAQPNDQPVANLNPSASSTPSVSVNNAAPEIVINQPIASDGSIVSQEQDRPSGDFNRDQEMVIIGDMIVGGSEQDDNSNVGGRDTESDSESNPDDASYLSNADNASAQRSVVTGATAGSDVGVASLPYDDESINSNPDDVDDDDDDDAEADDNDDDEDDEDDASDTAETEPETDEITGFIDEQLDRRTAPTNSSTFAANSAPTTPANRNNILHHVQWALGNHRDTLSNVGSTSTTQDPSLRRATINNGIVSGDSMVSMSNSVVGLARAFSIVIRTIADLLPLLRDSSELVNSSDMLYLSFSSSEGIAVHHSVEERLRNTWNWLITCMDCTETQLRFGCALSNRRMIPTIPTTLTPALNSTAPLSNSTFSSNSTSNRFSRLRSFQNQDDFLLLPSLSRTTSGLRRMTGLSLARPNSSTTNNTSSNSGVIVSNSNSTSATNSGVSTLDSNAARRDFLNYTMSLMRAHSNEHYDSLPVLDVASLKHVAYIFDSFVFYIRRGLVHGNEFDDASEIAMDQPITTVTIGQTSIDQNEPVEEKLDVPNFCGPNGRFFRRSNSTLFLGCPPPDPFSAPFHEALPLASKPHLLQPNSRREQLFGIPRPSNTSQAESMIESLPDQMSLSKRPQWNTKVNFASSTSANTVLRNQTVITEPTPVRGSIIQQASTSLSKPSVIVLAGSVKHQSTQNSQNIDHHGVLNSQDAKSTCNASSKNFLPLSGPNSDSKQCFFGNQQQHDTLLGRWRLTLELFGRLFVDDVGLEPNSIINELSGFPIKETKFRREMERLRNPNSSSSSSSQRDISFLKLDRDRNTMLQQVFKELNSVFSHTRRLSSNTSQASQHLEITRVKVTFKDEPGEGSGVARSFYTAFSEAVLANEKLPPLDMLSSSGNGGGSTRNSGSSSSYSIEAYQNYLVRIRNGAAYIGNNGTNNGSTSRSSVGVNGFNGAAPPTSMSSSPSESVSTVRRPRSPARYRLFAPTRRAQLIERVRNMHEGRPSSVAVSSPSSSTSPSPSSTPSSALPSSRGNGIVALVRYAAPPFYPTQFSSRLSSSHMVSSESRVAMGNRLYHRVSMLQPNHAAKITGMLLELPSQELFSKINSEEELRPLVDQVMEVINSYESRQANSESPANGTQSAVSNESSEQSSQQQQTPPSISHISSVLEPLIDISGSSSFKTSSIFKPTESSLIQDLLEEEDNSPLFYEPGTRGFYSPRAGRCTEARLNAFRNVGRIIGICFVQNELCPITFNRHVIKVILSRPVAWHDLAFFDSDLYESLRQLILDAESSNKEEIFSELDFRFAIDVSTEEGGQEVELMPNGRNIRVTPQNVYEYVRRYALYRMVDSQRQAIMAIRAGIFDVLPIRSFDGLTAEDFRLLLNGVNDINVQLLQTYVTFHDESGDGSEHLSYFRRWFWWVVERMTNEEKQDLIYFWTGSPALPASEEGFQPMPSITIRPRDDYYLVTANTCISRLYIPLYSSRTILRQKLLTSIKAKSFGFI